MMFYGLARGEYLHRPYDDDELDPGLLHGGKRKLNPERCPVAFLQTHTRTHALCLLTNKCIHTFTHMHAYTHSGTHAPVYTIFRKYC